MDRRLGLISLVALACSSLAFAQPRTVELDAVADKAAIDKTTQTEDLRFQDDGFQRMTVPVRLSGNGPYQFLVDTGADRTAISREIAAALKLTPGDAASLHTVAGVSMVATANVPSLQLTRKVLKVDDAPLLDSGSMGADGILGVDSLRAQRVMFDFEQNTMSVVPSATRELAVEPGSIVVKASRRNGRLVLTKAQADGQRVDVVLDTGSQITVGNSALRRMLVGRKQLKGLKAVELEAVTGATIAGDHMFVRELEIGGFKLTDLAIVFADAHTFKKLGLDDKPALLLGMNAMRAFKKVSIDFAARKFRVVLPEESSLTGTNNAMLRMQACSHQALCAIDAGAAVRRF